ncbi:hypothetical protein JCM33374_g2453 [Metschnikowia sp. JCM 33374]|nr:hypothetical protein JCM33374_g2453 [Metschnikowia sp. JCM 33374]
MTTPHKSIFISGATGFIAQHIIRLLLAKGYNVVGTVRSVEKGDHLKKLLGSDAFQYEVVADIGKAGAFDDALKKHPEVTVFLHTASPFHYNTDNIERDLYFPAINGTKNALSSVLAHGPQITKVVVTSAYGAMMNPAKFYDPSHTDTEESWNPITWDEGKLNAQLGYYASKKFAEQAARDFYKDKQPAFSLNYVNPVVVFGPQAYDADVKPELNASAKKVKNVLDLTIESSVPGLPDFFVDVRDVARAHLVAFENDLPNERLLLFSEKYSGQDLLDIINESFPSLKGKLPIGTPGTGYEDTGRMCQIDNRKTMKTLGFPFIDLKTSVVDAAEQILRVRGGN